MTWLERCLRWLHGLLTEPRRFTVSHVEDVPEHLDRGAFYLVGDPMQPWAAAFLCPCGCGDQITLSLIGSDHPSWRAYLSDDGEITLKPSVWRNKGCRSHFFVRFGRVI